MTVQLQISNHTKYNRYPVLFEFVRKLNPYPDRVLSFGCSTGEEIVSLSELYPDADIFGVERDEECRKKARALTDMPVSEFIPYEGIFDVIFAMSVLCRWPEDPPFPQTQLPYDAFLKGVNDLVLAASASGIIVIYNASWDATPILRRHGFSPVQGGPPKGFVTMRDERRMEMTEAPCVWKRHGLMEAKA